MSVLLRTAGLSALLVALTASAHAQTTGCATGGAGGAIPTSGTGGGGAFPTALPGFPMVAPLNVATLPPGAAVVTEVKMHGLSHTWVADLQFVLTDPSGGMHNLIALAPFSCDFNGDYVIVPPGACAQSYPAACTGADTFPVGAYQQDFGAWPSGTNGINNTPLDTIPAATGTWTLTVYDWAGGDIGTLTSWDICFGTAGGSTPTTSPVPASPANGALVVLPVNLTWSVLSCATTYDVELDGVVTTGITGTTTTVNTAAVGTHNWRVRAVNGSGAGPWSNLSAFDVPPPPPPSTCVAAGSGGAIPTSGTGDGTWPTSLPTAPFTSTASVTVPAGSTQLLRVRMLGLSHTWVGDLQFVLTDPTGGMHNILCRPGVTTACCGLNCDLDGTDYTIHAIGQQSLAGACNGASIPGGDYDQDFGFWNSGDLGIFNTPLTSIPVASGNWTLSIYDWAGGDSGALTSWELCFAGSGGPTTFCTPTGSGTSSGCIPTMSATGNPNVAQNNSCVITVANLEGQKTGLIFYGVSGQVSLPWCAVGGNSLLCVKAPTLRLFPKSTAGTNGQCDGQIVEDWNLFQNNNPTALGAPWSVGDTADMQCWFRDPPACKTTFLSEGLKLTYVP